MGKRRKNRRQNSFQNTALAQNNQKLPVNHSSDKPRSVTIKEEIYSGLLPHPDHLERYKVLYEDAPKIIFESFRNQTEHRIKIEEKVVNSGSFRATLGTVCSSIIILVAFILGYLLINNGKSLEGVSAIIGSLATLAGVFIYGTISNKKERLQRYQVTHPNK